MALSIPTQDQKAIIELFELNQSERQRLADVFNDSNRVMVIREYEEQIVESLALSENKARRILRVLVNMYSVMDYIGETPETIAKELIESFQIFESEAIRSAQSSEIIAFQEFLQTLLSFPESLGVSAKVLRVMGQHEHLFIGADSYTDLRPVFGTGDSSLQPAAAVMVHTLKIEYRKDLEEKTIYIALDSDDLYKLQETIERAINKHEALVKTLGSAIQILGSQ